jgi:hypothetical protein
MAKKKRRPRSRPATGSAAETRAERRGEAPAREARGAQRAGTGPAARGGANVARRVRKEEARRLREAERRRARRASALRRTVSSIGIAAAAVGAVVLFRTFTGPNDIPQAAVRAAERAGCTGVEQPATSAPSGQHLQPGQSHTYEDTPATSGLHAQQWLPTDPKVYEEQPPETNAVHSMEHGAVFVYYLPEGDGGISQDVVDRLATIAEGSQATYLAPYPSLAPDRALTLTAWNQRQSCPSSGDGGQPLAPATAATIVNGFVTAFECTGNAPENGTTPC